MNGTWDLGLGTPCELALRPLIADLAPNESHKLIDWFWYLTQHNYTKYLFSVTYYLELHKATTIYCTPHFYFYLPTKAKLVVWTFQNIDKTCLLGKAYLNSKSCVTLCIK